MNAHARRWVGVTLAVGQLQWGHRDGDMLSSRGRSLAVAFCVSLVVGMLVAPKGTSATPLCFGDTATIVATGSTTVGTSGDDVIVGTAAFDAIDGLGGNDKICGLGDRDFIEGGDGADQINGGGSASTPGDEDDTVAYRDSPAAVSIGMGGGSKDGWGFTEKLVNIENLQGSEHADNLTGNSKTNAIVGWGGNDVIEGGGSPAGAPSDVLLGIAGDDTFKNAPGAVIDGGPNGSTGDTIKYRGLAGPITVDLALSFPQNTGAGSQQIAGIENLYGSDGEDVLTGNGSVNRFYGGIGDDTLRGLEGDDFVYGEADDDTLSGGPGRDKLHGGANNGHGPDPDTSIEEGDTADYTDSAVGMTINLDAGTAKEGTVTDTLVDVENAIGADGFDNTITGDDGINVLIGGDEDDTFDPGERPPGPWTDIVHGGDNTPVDGSEANGDWLDLKHATGPVHAYFTEIGTPSENGQATYAAGGSGAYAFFYDVEHIAGSTTFENNLAGNDGPNLLKGGADADFLDGLGGDDVIWGMGSPDGLHDTISGDSDCAAVGNDQLFGGPGTTMFLPGHGADHIVGGGRPNDHVFFDQRYCSTTGVDVNLNAGTYTGGGTISGVENVNGTQYDDVITGNNAANFIFGWTGSDSIYGLGGADVLDGYSGSYLDHLDGGRNPIGSADTCRGGETNVNCEITS